MLLTGRASIKLVVAWAAIAAFVLLAICWCAFLVIGTGYAIWSSSRAAPGQPFRRGVHLIPGPIADYSLKNQAVYSDSRVRMSALNQSGYTVSDVIIEFYEKYPATGTTTMMPIDLKADAPVSTGKAGEFTGVPRYYSGDESVCDPWATCTYRVLRAYGSSARAKGASQ